MDERRQEAVSGTDRAGARPAGAAVVRRYPKPPPLWARLIALCLRPESWAEAARYPFWVTLVALIVALVVGSSGAAIGTGRSYVTSLEGLTQNYDARYSRMELSSDGVLSYDTPWKGPVRWKNIVVDPTDKTDIESLPANFSMLIGSKNVSFQFLGAPQVSTIKKLFPTVLPARGTKVIDGALVSRNVDDFRVPMFVGVAGLTFVWRLFAESLWIALTMYLVAPLVVIGAAAGGRSLMIPRRVAYRIAGAVLVPLVIFSGVLQAIGYSASAALSDEGALILWCVAAGAMAAWAGVMARRMYVPAKPQERRS